MKTKNKRPRIGEQIRYTGYVMHNCQFVGFIDHPFEVRKPDEGSKRGPLYLKSTISDWGGYIFPACYYEPERMCDIKEGPVSDAYPQHPAWLKFLAGPAGGVFKT